MRKKYFTDEARKAAKYATNARARAKRVALGLCKDCNKPVEGRKVCETCCRKSTVRKHKNGRFKTYHLGSKLSPERSAYTLRIVKILNPMLRANWTEVSPWLEKHFELYTEHYDSVLYTAIPLNITGNLDAVDADEYLMRAYYQRIGSQATLEDFVIAKIDYEKELKCRKATDEMVETTEQLTKVLSEKAAPTARVLASR